MPITPDDIKTLWNVPGEQAVKFLKRKGLILNVKKWNDLKAEIHARSFTVTGVAKLDVLQLVNDELKIAQREGKPMEQFRRDIRTRLTDAGFPIGDVLTSSRLELVYRQNLQTSYQAGRHLEQKAALDENAEMFPLVQLLIVNDDVTSDICGQLIDPATGEGLIVPASESDKYNFPAHFQCRSAKRLISKFEAKRRGLVATDAQPFIPAEGFDLPPDLKFQPDLSPYDPSFVKAYNATVN